MCVSCVLRTNDTHERAYMAFVLIVFALHVYLHVCLFFFVVFVLGCTCVYLVFLAFSGLGCISHLHFCFFLVVVFMLGSACAKDSQVEPPTSLLD